LLERFLAIPIAIGSKVKVLVVLCLVCIKKPIQARKGGIGLKIPRSAKQTHHIIFEILLAKAQSKGFGRMCLVYIKNQFKHAKVQLVYKSLRA
jgi:hypothetical protein